ncbi:TetR/AcrR family transcriptional regulator C-terminal ligand-binding domain-containing protein [Pseudoalteromonas mariniglutinosa]|uniref:TetR/AcrR family transcriptional regulator n=1 Tax=Pseudoalteromonas mariniglutinosa TaxID=206042 RepID=UPI00384EE1E4
MERNSFNPKNNNVRGAALLREDLTHRLCHALFEEWVLVGYEGISLSNVASRAGAGKAAIYRRWPAKKEFACFAIEHAGIDLTEFKNLGSLEADVMAYLKQTRRVLSHRLIRVILPDINAERLRSGDLELAVENLVEFRRNQGRALIERAIKRNELREGLNFELALDIIPSSLYWRMIVLGKSISREELKTQAKAIIAALKVL